MARTKDDWFLTRLAVGLRLDSTGRYYVSIAYRLLFREEGRILRHNITPDQADKLADFLKEYANKARERKLTGWKPDD